MGHEVLNWLGGVGARVEVKVCGRINNTEYFLKKITLKHAVLKASIQYMYMHKKS